ncbi:MAG: ABC transporter ATP-binding protein [Gemmatimonadota bacterium]|nr:ABC transporter ATP-binding protein [Gemmatimonadota bacterium]
MTSPSVTPAIRMTGIEKSFGPVRANRGASLEVMPGEIHALVGENGAGKSTLMKILGGLQSPDAGTMEVNGRDVTGWTTPDAIKAGIGIVHQHFMLVSTLTVAENIVLGMEPTKNGMFDGDAANAAVEKLGRDTGLVIDPTRKVSDLSVGEAQRVEILKVLFRGAKILILDEPTAVLSPPEVKELWNVMRKMRDNGGTIVLITHRLDEVMDLTDVITVMRAGQTVGKLVTKDTTPSEIAKEMVGREVVLSARDKMSGGSRATVRAATPTAGAGLEVRNLVVTDAIRGRVVDNVTFSLAPGEILGIAGVEGNGQTELIEAIAGLRKVDSGTISIDGKVVTNLDVAQRRDVGLTHIPEDRHRRGLVLDYSVANNLVLGVQNKFSLSGWLNDRKIRDYAAKQVAAYDIRPPISAAYARGFSGGNQQKIVLAREMGHGFTVLLASQPTRGVDVGAIEFIHAQLLAARDEGKAILLVSAELNEVMALSDRIAVMYRGHFAAVVDASTATTEQLGEYMIGAKKEGAA